MPTPETSDELKADVPSSNLSKQIAMAQRLYGPDVDGAYRNEGHIPDEREVAARAARMFPAPSPRRTSGKD